MRVVLFAAMALLFLMGDASYAARHKHPLSVVNINQASTKELITINGIGKKRAQDIVTYRKAHGKFKTLNDLGAVKGISNKLLARIKLKNAKRINFS